ncbi:hypothetical protein INT44_001966 [Umbelopsis vinacea]|uniref:Mediator of RNA polymerase II transcription subunit 7 n=1 Tax=Umbelopsis vinacea TaxID=44442 RepID=A0A8H7Q5N9_9FUNG|nr:hypothetical protein INT44_001966 [Umbelopsis vinacea]KAI9284950.1 MED7 protein-domain-containing protein [Umbelopsis sp. AD052]
MTEQKKSGSAWPEPPSFFTRYTDDNLEKARLFKQKRIDPADVRLEFPPELLEPPPPVEGSYIIFDQHWQTEDKLPTLEERNVTQLYPTGKIDRVFELKKLLRSLMSQFLILLDILVREPDKFAPRITDISNILINIHHILNEYRPHQARETLRLMLETQLKKKVQATEELRKRRDEVRSMLKGLKDEVKLTSLSEEMEADEDVAMEEASLTTTNTATAQSISQVSAKMLELVDSLE